MPTTQLPNYLAAANAPAPPPLTVADVLKRDGLLLIIHSGAFCLRREEKGYWSIWKYSERLLNHADESAAVAEFLRLTEGR